MTPEERQLITGLFDRMRGFALAGKDAEAETLINQQVGSLRDAPYMLVQSVLVQEHALQQADARIKELEEQVRTLQSAPQQQSSAGSSSFLGGLFGGRSSAASSADSGPGPERGPSVPPVGSRAAPSGYESRPAWGGQQAAASPGAPPLGQPQAPASGGFLQSAMTTAAGVAGGMLAANAISSMFGGSSAHAASTTAGAQTAQPQNAANTGTSDATPAPAAESRPDAVQEASYEDDDDDDDSGWFGGDDGGYDA